MQNPLVESHTLPPFEQIQPEHIVPAVEQLLNQARQSLENQLATLEGPTWENLYQPLEDVEDQITQAWSPVSHLHGVMNSDALREAYENGQQLLTAYYSDLGQNKPLFNAYESLKASESFTQLAQPQKQTIANAIRDFRLSGVNLEGEQAERYKAIRARLSTLTTNFSNNVLDATHGWHKLVESIDDLAGLPDFIIQGAETAAQDQAKSGYLLTLDLPVYITVMTQADNRALREEMYQAYCTRASQEGPTAGQWDNTDLIEEILTLRREQAQLLGFEHYADLSIAPKMAKPPTKY